MPHRSHLYDELSWPEVRDAPKDTVIVIPVGTLEDHGPHLPLNTDVVIVEAVSRRAVELEKGITLIMPT
jgi:creatinine amidohydrolase/Fe(II)-dependent formamide hydrolase-like protein